MRLPAEICDSLKNLLFNNLNRENQVARADVVNHIQTLYNLTEAGVHAVEVLCVLAVVADEELRATSILASVSHRHHATVVVLTLG